MAAKEIQRQSSMTADIKARMPHLDPDFTLPAGANILTWPPWEFKGANIQAHKTQPLKFENENRSLDSFSSEFIAADIIWILCFILFFSKNKKNS